MKIKSLVLLFVGLFLLPLIVGCDMEYLEDMINEIYQDEETLNKVDNNSTDSVSGNASSTQKPLNPPSEEASTSNPPIVPEPPVSPEQSTPTPGIPEVEPPVEVPPSQSPSEEPSTPSPPIVPVPPAPAPQPPETKPESPVVPSIPTPDYMQEVGLNIPSDSDRDPNQMYFAIKLKGVSPRGYFYQEEKRNIFGFIPAAYPRGYEFSFHTEEEGSKSFLIKGAKEHTPGYTDEYGFGNSKGTKMETKYYIGHHRFKVPLKSSGVSEFSFATFAMIDYMIDGFGGSYSRPYFCRVNASKPLTIKIPTDKYDPAVHKNVARVTIFFEPDTDKNYNYHTVIFDGFEPK